MSDITSNNNANTGLKPYLTNPRYSTKLGLAPIGARRVVTTRLSLAVGVDALKIINILLLLHYRYVPYDMQYLVVVLRYWCYMT
jgi:hypothetical protein